MMVSKADILAEIRRTAIGDRPLGRLAFASETGIGDAQVARYWARWNDAVREAGFTPNELWQRVPDDEVLSSLASETRRLGRLPTIRELRVRHHEDDTVPSRHVFGRWPTREWPRRLSEWCASRPEFADVVAIVGAIPPAEEPAPTEPRSRPGHVVLGFVYLIKMGRHHKIGRSNAAGRRERELAIQLPERAQTVHVIQTDDPVGIEAYWHHRFRDRRGNGEWFALTSEDVAAFKRRKFM